MKEWFDLRPVELDFLKDAPLRVEVEVETPLARGEVWAAFTNPGTWRDWWPRVREASYPDQAPPYGVGTLRRADVGGELFEETILAWDVGARWTYRIDRCTAPLAHAQVESTELADAAGGGTRVRWTLASDPKEGLRAAREALPGVLEALLAEALANLERHLARGAP